MCRAYGFTHSFEFRTSGVEQLLPELRNGRFVLEPKREGGTRFKALINVSLAQFG